MNYKHLLAILGLLAISTTAWGQPRSAHIIAHKGGVASLNFGINDTELISSGDDRVIKIWDLTTNRVAYTLNDAFSVSPFQLAVDSRHGRLFIPGYRIRAWEYRAFGSTPLFYAPHNSHTLTLSPDGSLLAWGGPNTIGVVPLYHPDRATTWEATKENTVRDIVFSPSGKRLATTSQPYPDGPVDLDTSIWDVQTGKLNRRIKGTDPEVPRAIFLDEATIAVAAGDDVKSYSIRTGKVLHTWSGSQRDVLALAYSRQGRILAAGDRDGVVHLWHPDGRHFAFKEQHSGPVLRLTFSPSGRLLASGGLDGNILVLHIPK
jgi:WD40 repeat protein